MRARRKAIFFLILLLTSYCSVLFIYEVPEVEAPPAWALSNYERRRAITINGSSSGTLTDYAIRIDTIYDYSFPDGRFYSLGAERVTVTGNPDDMHYLFPVHKTDFEAINKVVDGASRTYFAYDCDVDNSDAIRLYWSDDLEGAWTPYTLNPVLGPVFNEYRKPSVTVDGGFFVMFLADYANTEIERWNSSDGIVWNKIEDITVPTETIWMAPYIWFNPNDSRWYLYHSEYNVADGLCKQWVRNASAIADLSGAPCTELIGVPGYQSVIGVMYRDSKYWLVVEDYIDLADDKWFTFAYSGDSPGNFTETTDSPILVNEDVCAQMGIDPSGTAYVYYDRNVGVADWYARDRTLGATSRRGYEVDLDGNVRTDFGDVRFTNATGYELDYWMENKTDGDNAVFWVEVDFIDQGPTDTTIYIYYDYPSATTTSDGEETFPFFDDFPGVAVNGTKWTSSTDIGGTLTVANSELTATLPGGAPNQPEAEVRSKAPFTFDVNYTVRANVTLPDGSGRYYAFMGLSNFDDAVYPCVESSEQGLSLVWGDTSNYYVRTATGDVLTNVGNDLVTTTPTTQEVRRNSTGLLGQNLWGSPIQSKTNLPAGALSVVIGMEGSNVAGAGSIVFDWVLVRDNFYPEPEITDFATEETQTPANTAPVLGAYTISDWDGNALYTDGEFSNWWLQATDADGGSDIATFECAFQLGSDWCNFTFTSSTGLWVKDTDCPITIHEDGQSSSGTTKNALGILAIDDWAEPTENVVVYGRVTDASSATSGWGVLSGPGFSVREPGSSGETGGDSDPDDDENDDEVDEEPIPECWMMDVDNLNSMDVDALRVLADVLGLPYTEDTSKAELVEAIYNEATRLCEEGETPFSSCLMDEGEKLAKLEYLMGLSVQELRGECQSLGISYLLWREPEPYIILIFTVGYHCTVPDEFYDGVFDPEDLDGDGTPNWDDPDMFDETRKGIGARIEDIHLEESLPWMKGNGYILIILLLVFAFLYSQVKKKDKPGSRGESLIRPRQGGYLPGERSKK